MRAYAYLPYYIELNAGARLLSNQGVSTRASSQLWRLRILIKLSYDGDSSELMLTCHDMLGLFQ